MRLILRQIDFERGTVVVVVPAGAADGMIDRFDRFLAACAEAGLDDVRVGLAPGATDLQRAVVESVAARHGARTAPATGASRHRPRAECLVGNADEGNARYDARLRLASRARAVERATAAAVLVAMARDADDGARADLQMCVHELVTNTVEHGVFRDAFEVRLDVRADAEGFRVAYGDRAEPFATHPRPVVDLDGHFERGSRRGLGLQILARLPASIRYRRLSGWNVTEFRVQRRRRPADPRERSNAMARISTEIVPCDVPGTTVVRPSGTIDSSTTQLLEEQITRVIDEGGRYIVIDLRGVDFVSSAGIGLFLGTAARLRSSGGDLAFMNMPSHVREVFEIINLAPYFRTVDSPEEMVAPTRGE